MAAITSQHDVRARDGVKNDFLTAVLGLADKAEDTSSGSRALLSFFYERALTERTCDRNPFKTFLEGLLRRFVIRDIPPWLQAVRRRKPYKTSDAG